MEGHFKKATNKKNYITKLTTIQTQFICGFTRKYVCVCECTLTPALPGS